MVGTMDLRPLTDAVLLSRLEALVSQERGCAADVIEHLAEVDRREIVIDRGYATLFDYCTKTLRYSEAAAFLRIRAARAAVNFPRVLDDLRSGAIHLDAIMRLYPHLTNENSNKLLDQASGATKREVMALAASLDPAASVPERDVVRILPPRPPEISTVAGPIPREATIIAPPSRVRLGFTADNAFLALVDRLRSLRRHKFPEGRLEDLLKESVEALLDQVDPDRRTARAAGARRSKTNIAGRYIPESIKRQVRIRDEGHCAYVAPDGRRCESRDFLEYDHIQPWALGGPSDRVDNIRLLCRPHNQRLARRRFGPRKNPALVRPDAVEQDRRP